MDSYKPDTLYYLFAQVMRLHYHRAHMLLDQVGVYPGQPPMLIALSRKDGQSQKELAAALSIQPATITVMLKRMEKTGLVERRQDEEDQRISRVYLTDKGKELCREVDEIIKIIDHECFSNLTAEEKVILRRLFVQMRENLSEACDNKISLDF